MSPRQRLDHKSFAALLPSEKQTILMGVANLLPFPADLVVFHTDSTDRTYAVVQIRERDEYATYLVAFGLEVHLENGCYGYSDKKTAVDAMFRRCGY